MNFVHVESSNLEAVAWEEGFLYVAFTGGRLYRYDNVPFAVYQGLLSANSKGRYLHLRIKDVYPYQRIR